MASVPSSQQQPPNQPQFQPKLAPWAKMSENNTFNGNQSTGLSLTEIQKLEEEREREAKMRREMLEAEQARARQEEEARRPQVRDLSFLSELFLRKTRGDFLYPFKISDLLNIVKFINLKSRQN